MSDHPARDYPYDPSAAIEKFRKTDPELSALIDRIGSFRLDYRSDQTPFQALLQSIVYQQLSGHAAGAIYGRVLALHPDAKQPSANDILRSSEEDLRKCGLSAAKVRAVKDLAEKAHSGALPDAREAQGMDDERLIETFSAVRGIGRWTVEMLLIFNLGRPDVLPVGDLGVRRGFMFTYGLDEMPAPDRVLEHGKRWAPYRSVASWYMWRAADGGGVGKNRA